MPDTFGDLRSVLDELAGFDLDDTQRDALLNEGHRELAVRSEWNRAEIDLGPTVDGIDTYAIPDDVHRILELTVGAGEYAESDRLTFARLTRGDLYLNSRYDGLWRRGWSAANARQVILYPSPAAGLSIDALLIERPALMTAANDVPVVPPEFRQAIADYAEGKAFGSQEDNLEARTYYEERFDRWVADLRRLAFSGGRAVTFWEVA